MNGNDNTDSLSDGAETTVDVVVGNIGGFISDNFKPLPINVVKPREKKINITKNTLMKHFYELKLPKKPIYFTENIYINFEEIMNFNYLDKITYKDPENYYEIINKYNSLLLDKIIEVSIDLQKKYIFRNKILFIYKLIEKSSAIFKKKWTVGSSIYMFNQKFIEFLKNFDRNDFTKCLYIIFMIYMELDFNNSSSTSTPTPTPLELDDENKNKYNISMTNYFIYLNRINSEIGGKNSLYKLLDGIYIKKINDPKSVSNKADIILFNMIEDYKKYNTITNLTIFILFDKILYNMDILKNIKVIDSNITNTSKKRILFSTTNDIKNDYKKYMNTTTEKYNFMETTECYNYLFLILVIFVVLFILFKNETYNFKNSLINK